MAPLTGDTSYVCRPGGYPSSTFFSETKPAALVTSAFVKLILVPSVLSNRSYSIRSFYGDLSCSVWPRISVVMEGLISCPFTWKRKSWAKSGSVLR